MASSSSNVAVGAYMRPIPGNNGPRRPHILLAASGSVAAVKFEHLCRSFLDWADVAAVLTNTAVRFLGRTQFPNDAFVYTDGDEWIFWNKLGDPVLHIELQSWADIMVIAPLSANTLAKIAGGLCDNLLTSIVRAWDYNKPIFVAPGMNPMMWTNHFTEQQLDALDNLGINLIPPATSGAMAEVSHIFNTIRLAWEKKYNQPGHVANR